MSNARDYGNILCCARVSDECLIYYFPNGKLFVYFHCIIAVSSLTYNTFYFDVFSWLLSLFLQYLFTLVIMLPTKITFIKHRNYGFRMYY